MLISLQQINSPYGLRQYLLRTLDVAKKCDETAHRHSLSAAFTCRDEDDSEFFRHHVRNQP
jgi:hypothetical protein